MASEHLLQEIAAGQGQNLTALAKLIPSRRSGKPCHVSCLLRWATNDVRTPDGQLVKLEALWTPGGWLSSWAAVERFLVAINPDRAGEAQTVRAPSKREKAAQRASDELAALGI